MNQSIVDRIKDKIRSTSPKKVAGHLGHALFKASGGTKVPVVNHIANHIFDKLKEQHQIPSFQTFLESYTK